MSNDKMPPEFAAQQTIYAALAPLDEPARKRVINYIIDMLEIPTETPTMVGQSDPDPQPNTAAIAAEQAKAPKYSTLADLFDAAQPDTNVEKALVAGYWLQVCQGQENFDGQSANTLLKNLGHGLPNITNALAGLKSQKPSLALQLGKSGSSQQARKTYKITEAGIRKIEAMING
jgi:hypothetical protein